MVLNELYGGGKWIEVVFLETKLNDNFDVKRLFVNFSHFYNIFELNYRYYRADNKL